jgi:hypothetical protein
MTTRADEVVDQLARLPAYDLDPWRAENIRRRAHVELARGRWLSEHPRLGALVRLHRRLVEPALVVGISASYLVWAAIQVAALYR